MHSRRPCTALENEGRIAASAGIGGVRRGGSGTTIRCGGFGAAWTGWWAALNVRGGLNALARDGIDTCGKITSAATVNAVQRSNKTFTRDTLYNPWGSWGGHLGRPFRLLPRT